MLFVWCFLQCTQFAFTFILVNFQGCKHWLTDLLVSSNHSLQICYSFGALVFECSASFLQRRANCWVVDSSINKEKVKRNVWGGVLWSTFEPCVKICFGIYAKLISGVLYLYPQELWIPYSAVQQCFYAQSLLCMQGLWLYILHVKERAGLGGIH